MSTGPRPLRATIAEEIRALMARRRLSAVRLGVAIGRSQSYMSRRLTGEIPFDLDDLDSICATLDVPISALIGSPRPDSRATTGRTSADSPRLPVAA